MASPQIVNRRPDQGDTSVDALTPFRFGVRDADTRVDLLSIYSLVAYGDGVYVPSELPGNDDALEGAGVEVYLSTFDDASGTTEPGNPCDQTIEDVSGIDVYRIEKSDADGVAQEGVLYLTVPAQAEAQPYTLKVTLDLVNVNVDTFSYVTFSGFTGVMMGMAYWPENTGVFLFFVDDGTKKIVVAGPATDGIGTRTVSTSVVFDWSAEAYTYSMVLDPTVHGRKVSVYATDSAGVETLLDEVDLDSLNEFNATVRMGKLLAEDSPTDKVTFLLGGDFPDMGDYIDVYDFAVLDFGRVLMVSGSPTGSSTVEVHPTEEIFVYGPEGASEWSTVGSGVIATTTATLTLTSDGGGDYLTREEPDLAAGEWLLVGRVAGGNSLHPGVYSTGMGLSLRDGTRAFNLVLLDDFARRFLGIEEADSTDDAVVSGYKVPADGTDWEAAFDFVLLGSTSRDALRLFVDSDTATAVEHTYTASGYPAAAETDVRVGYFESGADLSGTFYLAYLWVLPNCTFFEAVDGTFPEAQGWTRANSASAVRSLTADDQLELDCGVTGEYDLYYLSDATYDPTSGVAALFRFDLEDWTDSAGAASPIRTEFGPVAAVQVGTNATVQVSLTQDEFGTFYVFLPGGDSTVSDVLAQNTAGRAVSAEIDLSAPRVIHLDVKPRQYVRLFIDHDPVPAIEVAWSLVATVLRSLPTNMPAGAVVALGSLGEDTGVRGYFDHFRVSIGKGYDLSVTLDVTEDILQESVYGSLTDVLIDVQDED